MILFCSIVPCLFEFILMPKSSLQECYMLFTAVTYKNTMICHFLHLMCASYEHELYMCFELCHAFFTEVLSMYFLINVGTSTSMQTRLRDVPDFSPCSAVIFMPCKLDATERSMHILRYFSKDVLNIWL